MLQAVIQGNSEVRVEDQDLVKEINGFLSGSRIDGAQVHFLSGWEGVQIVESLLIGDKRLVFLVWCADHLENDRELIISRDGESVSVFHGLVIVIGAEREAGLAGEERSPIEVGWGALLHHTE